MKKLLMNPIFLPIVIESCSTATAGNINSGTYKECLEGVTTKLYMADVNFRFATVADFKDMAKWEAAIEAREIVPLFNVYEVASDNTEATKYETGSFVYTTKKEVKKMTSESYLSPCSHKALKGIETSNYTQVFEVTEKGEILGVFDTDGIKIKGQDVSNFDVAIRERPTNDKPAYSMTTITYRDFEEFEDNGIIVKPSWDPNLLNGIFEITLLVQSASATSIVFAAKTGCGAEDYPSLVVDDMLLLSIAGAAQTIATLTFANGLYTASGTGLVSGTLATDGVIEDAVSGALLEGSPVPVTIV